MNALPLQSGMPRERETVSGYYGQPALKPPVWTWEVPLYFFIGGTAGMAAVIALGALATGTAPQTLRHASWIAATGAFLSPALLVSDLGHPTRFLNMLRVFKRHSAMSVGVWVLVLFGATSSLAVALLEALAGGMIAPSVVAQTLWQGTTLAAALTGAALATYTGVLLGATAVPVWNHHRMLLPAHFGAAALGSAACALELVGPRIAALNTLAVTASVAETALFVVLERNRHGAADRALREGLSGASIRLSASLTGPLALALRLGGLSIPAAAVFLSGALLGRYAWLAAGRVSARDPEAALRESGSRSSSQPQ